LHLDGRDGAEVLADEFVGFQGRFGYYVVNS
jgi:hypothetical protein